MSSSQGQHPTTGSSNPPLPPPRLCRDLELALSTLYSLPLRHHNQQQQHHDDNNYLSHQKEAHEFLIHIQSRNVRRKIQSLKQRQQSKQQQSSTTVSSSPRDAAPVTVEMGSSWLACLYVLLCQNNNENPSENNSSTERLFCTQTLLHRLRRTKINESIDWEVEHGDREINVNEALQLYQDPCQYLQSIIPTYQHWIRTINPFVGAVVDTYTYNTNANARNSSTVNVLLQPNDEERIKGDLSLLTLAAIAYETAVSIVSTPDSNNIHMMTTIINSPLLSTIAESLATLALRVRYNQRTTTTQQQHNGSKTEPSTHQQTPPIVTIVAHSLAVVWETVMKIQSNNNNDIMPPPVNRLAFGAALHACLGAIPDTLLGGVGGARGRLSIDPKCLQTANQELRAVGLTLLSETMQQYAASNSHYHQSSEEEMFLDLYTLNTLYQWAKNLPITSEFVPLIKKYISSESPHHRQAALACVIAICEGGAWTVQEVLSYSLGLHDQQLVQQPNKKRQTSKSKKRHKDLLENGTTESLLAEVHREVHQRGEIACTTTLMVWNGLVECVKHGLAVANADPASEVHGEGPIGCLCSSANACLPHIVKNPTYAHAKDLFLAIVVPFHEVCRSGNKTARALAFEPLYTLHTAILDTVRTSGPLGDNFESLVVDHFFECSMGLAAACSYPYGYFDDLATNSDEELEIERNDVRDLLRAVAGSGESGSTSDAQSAGDPIGMSLKLLAKLLQACEHSIAASRQHHQLFEESSIHALSALAKPLNHLAKSLNSGAPAGTVEVLLLATRVLTQASEDLVAAFDRSLSAADLLPRSRVANMATASLSPMFDAVCMATNAETQQVMAKAVDVLVQAAASSIVHLPELAARSALVCHQYDIRGTMRGPGGEDHVGILSFMRLVFESDNLARFVVRSSPQIINRLCQIYRELKTIEIERGQGVLHGRGVTPQSGRILLRVLCHIELLSEGQAGASDMLHQLFRSTVATVSSFRSRSPLDEQAFYRISEAIFDIGAFSPFIVRSLFRAEGGPTVEEDTACLEVLTSGCLEGYKRLSTTNPPDGVIIQWNRLRAAVFKLLKISANPDITPRAAEIIREVIKTECEAIHHQCAAGPTSCSSLFHDEIVSADSIPAGLFVRAIGEVLELSEPSGLPLEALQQCITTLHASRNFVLSSILLTCSDPCTGAFVDPRPTLAEAWFYSMIQCAKVASRGTTNTIVEDLLTDTVLSIVTLLFYPNVLVKSTLVERRSAPGLSFDGPQSLLLADLLAHFFALGPTFLEKLALQVLQQVPLECGLDLQALDSCLRGVAILGAALFRASLGGLPPWAVEATPEIYSALYMALQRNPDSFRLVLQLSLHLRLSPSAHVGIIGSVQPGELLAGRHFETVSDQVKGKFVQEATELCRKDDTTSWRRLKVLIKQLSGGKKKDTDFGQKPAVTSWELERI